MEAYYNPREPCGYGGIDRLRLKTKTNPINWLKGQPAYTLHKPVRRRYKRRRYIVETIDSLWQVDLADMQKLSRWNDTFKYLLVVIDVFSKFLWVIPVKNKSAGVTKSAFEYLFTNQARKPVKLMSDKGTEFNNSIVKTYLENLGIHYYTSQNPDTKAAVAERVIRTIKTKLYRFFTHEKTWRYLEVLPKIVSAYNESKHRSIGMAPIDVNEQNVEKVRNKLYPYKLLKKANFKFKLGETVRLAKGKAQFGKGYNQHWTEEIFNISSQLDTEPPTYNVADFEGNVIAGSFYEQELQLVTDSGVYDIDYIIKTRKRAGKLEYLVAWKGYPISMASWVDQIIRT